MISSHRPRDAGQLVEQAEVGWAVVRLVDPAHAELVAHGLGENTAREVAKRAKLETPRCRVVVFRPAIEMELIG